MVRDTGEDVDPLILEGARKVAARHGWRAATLADIAKAAGISRMTLHRRGADRAVIRRALVTVLEEAYRDAFWPALISHGPARDRLEQMLLAQCDVEARFPGLDEVLDEAEHGKTFHEPGDEAMSRDVFVSPLRRVLVDGQADGTLSVVDPEETATLLFNLVSWTYRHLRRSHRWSHNRAAAAIIRVVLHGVVEPSEPSGS